MTPLNKWLWFTAILAALAVADGALLLNGAFGPGETTARSRTSDVVRSLGLTDLALWTEARYTRHPTQTDFFSPFQDLPGGMEHFPAGALISPPSHLLEGGAGGVALRPGS